MYIYCLFCESNKCETVVRAMREQLNCQALYPKQLQHTRINGRPADIERALMPGYVFLYADSEPLTTDMLRKDGVLKILRDSENNYLVREDGLKFAQMLLKKNGIIGTTPVYQAGQKIRLAQGVFNGLDAEILKVDHRNARMKLQLHFADNTIKTWVGYEIMGTEQ